MNPSYTVTVSSTKLLKEWKYFLMNDRTKSNSYCSYLLSCKRFQLFCYYMAENSILRVIIIAFCLASLMDTQQILDPYRISHPARESTPAIWHVCPSEQCITGTQNTANIIHSPDTDVFLLLIAYCKKKKLLCGLYFDTGAENQRRLIHIQTVKKL